MRRKEHGNRKKDLRFEIGILDVQAQGLITLLQLVG